LADANSNQIGKGDIPMEENRQVFRRYQLLCGYEDRTRMKDRIGRDRELREEMAKLQKGLSRVKG